MARTIKEEKSFITQLRERIGNDYMPYWILWKYAPNLLPDKLDTFEDFYNKYQCIQVKKLTERDCEKFLYYDKVQQAVKWLLKKQRGIKMIELYNHWFELAKSDSNALREFLKLQDVFFKNDELSELETILRKTNVNPDDTDEEYEMSI